MRRKKKCKTLVKSINEGPPQSKRSELDFTSMMMLSFSGGYPVERGRAKRAPHKSAEAREPAGRKQEKFFKICYVGFLVTTKTEKQKMRKIIF